MAANAATIGQTPEPAPTPAPAQAEATKDDNDPATTQAPAPATDSADDEPTAQSCTRPFRRFRLPSIGPITGNETPLTRADIERLKLTPRTSPVEIVLYSLFVAVATVDAVMGFFLSLTLITVTRPDTTIHMETSQMVFLTFTTIMIVITALGVAAMIHGRVRYPFSVYVEDRGIQGVQLAVAAGIVIEILMSCFVPRYLLHPISENILDPNQVVRACVHLHAGLYIAFVTGEIIMCSHRKTRIDEAVKAYEAREQAELAEMVAVAQTQDQDQGRLENGEGAQAPAAGGEGEGEEVSAV